MLSFIYICIDAMLDDVDYDDDYDNDNGLHD
jgi:hypothetical protein